MSTEYTLLHKLTSGRYLLTLMTGVAFVILCIAYVRDPARSISGEALAGIIVMVFSNYFNKDRSNGGK